MRQLMAVKGTGVASFYRVPSCDHTEIKRVIDFCPAGVIVPMVMDERDAARAVAAWLFVPYYRKVASAGAACRCGPCQH